MQRVCVFCGSSFGGSPLFRLAAEALGSTIAERRLELIYGGGRVGLMGVIARAVLNRGGRVTGVIPESLVNREVALTECSELRVVATMHERKALMMELSDAFIAMPGGFGTLDELFEVMTWFQLGLHNKPAGLLNSGGYFDLLLAFLDHAAELSFLHAAHRSMLPVSDDPGELLDALEAFEPPVVDKVKWIRDNAT